MTKDKIKSSWPKILMAAIAAGLMGHVFDWWDLSKDRDDNYIEKYIECQSDIVMLNKQMSLLQNHLLTLEIGAAEIPFPYWMKTKDGTIIFINKAYQKSITEPLGIAADEMINTKGEILGADFVKQILANDRKVIAKGRLTVFLETVPEKGIGYAFKFPLRSPNGSILGTGGIWIPQNITEGIEIEE